MRVETTPSPAEGALRSLIEAQRASGDVEGATMSLRRLRRIAQLKPNEHRRLFLELRRRGRPGLLARYISKIARASPTPENWTQIALAFWSEQRFDLLFAWAVRCPAGLKAGAKVLEVFAGVSEKYREAESTSTIRAQVAVWRALGWTVQRPSDESGQPVLEKAASLKPPLAVERAPQSALSAAKVGSDSPAVLREMAEQARRVGDVAGLEAKLHQLRRLVGLKPGEHRQLFQLLKAKHGSAWLQRYARWIGHASVGRDTWHTLVLFYWSEGSEEALKTCLRTEVCSSEQRFEFAVALARNSLKHKDHRRATLLLSFALEVGSTANDFPQILTLLAEAEAGRRTLLEVESVAATMESSRKEAMVRRHALLEPDIETTLGNFDQAQVEISSPPHGSEAMPIKVASTNILESFAALLGAQRSLVSLVDVCAGMSGVARAPEHARLLDERILQILHCRASNEASSRAEIEALEKAVGQALWLIPSLGRALRQVGQLENALRLYVLLPPETLKGQEWFDLAEAAIADGFLQQGVALCQRAICQGQGRRIEPLAKALAQRGQMNEALSLWRSTETAGPEPRIRLAVGRLLHAARHFQQAFDEALLLFEALWPLDALSLEAQSHVIALGRLALRSGTAADVWRRPPEAWLARHAQCSGRLGCWVRAMVLAAVMDRPRALTALHAADACTEAASGLELDIRAEIAALHLRHQDHGAARAILTESGVRSSRAHEEAFGLFTQVEALCGAQSRYPECVIDVIFEELAGGGAISYEPQPAHVLTISGTLAQGGSERQTVNIIRALAAEPRVSKQTVLVRSIEAEHGFFWPALESVPAEKIIYGEKWRLPTDIDSALPQLKERRRLRQAILLMPHSMKEEVIRITMQLLRARPRVVHVRQDLTAAALACAVAGAPTFFIHRGSLARNTWEHSPLNADTVLRPMRHLYRKLLTETSFFLVNNSAPGLESDKVWTGIADPARFHVVHNAVEFERLGAASGPNLSMRAELGIPATAPVVGGVFRMVGVKRPMLWIEIANLVHQTLPDAHFIIAGEPAEYGEALRTYAVQHGFSKCLHMPGAVANVGDWYRCFDVLLLTSEREGLPNVNIEAQHFGVPVVSSAVGGASETLLDGVTGFLVAPEEGADAFAKACCQALVDHEWRTHACKSAPQYAHLSFGVASAVRKLLDLYDA